LEEQLDHFEIDRSRVRYLVISHAHHDHCGAVPYLLRRYPGLEVVASAYGATVLGKDKPVRLMQDLNTRTLDRLGRAHSHDGIPLGFAAIPVSHPVGDGAELELGGGLTLRFYATPGHSRCSMSVYVPELAALFPGDSIPYPEAGRTELTVTANHDYGDYLESLRKLEGLPLEFVAYEHGGALLNGKARDVVTRGLEAALRQRDRIRKRFEELGDVELLVEEISGKYGALELFQLVPGDAMRAIVQRMVRSALGRD
jgi:glyoxylase-like metal-dependent hydrolase (beta-lactamase superfamily II)